MKSLEYMSALLNSRVYHIYHVYPGHGPCACRDPYCIPDGHFSGCPYLSPYHGRGPSPCHSHNHASYHRIPGPDVVVAEKAISMSVEREAQIHTSKVGSISSNHGQTQTQTHLCLSLSPSLQAEHSASQACPPLRP